MDSWKPIKIAYDVVVPSTGVKTGLSPIILIHGMMSSKEIWNHISGPIANGTNREVYRLDMRNHGDSDWNELFDYVTMAKDVSYFMQSKNIPKAIVVGHSMGGKIAMTLAFTEPEKVEKLVIEDISPAPTSDLGRRFAFLYLKLLRESIEVVPCYVDELTAKTKIFEFMIGHTPKEQTTERTKFDPDMFQLRKTENGYEFKANIDVVERNFALGNSKNLLKGSYSGEVIFIYGTKSIYNVIGDKDFILKLFPEVTFYAIEGATHMVHKEFPREFVSATIEVLNDI